MASKKTHSTGHKRGHGRRSTASSEQSASAQNERFVKKYYPVFENLVLFILGRGEYFEAFKAFIKREVNYRGAIVGKGIALFSAAMAFVLGAVVFLVLGLFFLFRDLTGSSTIAAFIMTLVSVLLGLLFFLLTANVFRRLFDRHPESGVAHGTDSAETIE